MEISSKLLRLQISLFKSFLNGCNIEKARLVQSKMGNLISSLHKSKVCYDTKIFKDFIGEWIAPKSQKLNGVILYLHGGGYVLGDIDYAKGFGTTLSALANIKVFCAAYRLAPEFPFPAALDDALVAYKYLLDSGYSANQIILCGESAGGGLILSLTLKLKELSLPLPSGIIAISPWCDLTLSGNSFITNKVKDPLLTKERLSYYASIYSSDTSNPFVSPLLGELSSFPSTLIFAGSDEILLDDSVMLHKKLINSGNISKLFVANEMWHAYILYGVKEAKRDLKIITEFIKEKIKDTLNETK